MRVQWLLVAMVVVLGSCSTAAEERTGKLGDESVRVQAKGKTDAFGLPLVIDLQPPPVPKEIEGPSAPIKDSPKTAPKEKKERSSSWLRKLGL